MIHHIERKLPTGKWQPIGGLVYQSRQSATLALNRLAQWSGLALRVRGQRVYKVYPTRQGSLG